MRSSTRCPGRSEPPADRPDTTETAPPSSDGGFLFSGDVDRKTRLANSRLRVEQVTVWSYLVSFTIQVCSALWIAAHDRMAEGLDKGHRLISGLDAWRDVWVASGKSMATVTAVSVVVAEIVRLIVILAQFVKKDLDRKLEERSEKRIEKRIAKAVAEAIAKSKDWFERCEAARAKGEAFDEPAPWDSVEQDDS